MIHPRGPAITTGIYWDESAYYEFFSREVDLLEEATNELQRRCLEAVLFSTNRGQYREVRMQESTELARVYREAKLIAWAMMGGLAFYAGVVEFFSTQVDSFKGYDPERIKEFKDYFILGGVLAFILIRAARTAIMKREPDDTFGRLLGRLKTAHIVGYAIAEIPAVLGLVLFLFTGDRMDFYLLGVFSILAMVLYYPKLNHWEVWLQKPA